jgi:hypothetical protein
MDRSKIDRLLDLLEREKDAFLSGDYSIVAQIFLEKSRLISQFDLATIPRGFRAEILDIIERNQVIIAAAIQGLRSASSQLDAERNGKGTSSIYTAGGLRATICRPEIQSSMRF